MTTDATTTTETGKRPGITDSARAAELGRLGAAARTRNLATKAAGDISKLRSRLTARLAAAVDDEDIDTVIKAAPTIRMLTEDAADAGGAIADPLAARYRALGYEPPY